VTLGVGVAVATTPGIALADPSASGSGTSSSTQSDSSDTNAPSATDTSSSTGIGSTGTDVDLTDDESIDDADADDDEDVDLEVDVNEDDDAVDGDVDEGEGEDGALDEEEGGSLDETDPPVDEQPDETTPADNDLAAETAVEADNDYSSIDARNGSADPITVTTPDDTGDVDATFSGVNQLAPVDTASHEIDTSGPLFTASRLMSAPDRAPAATAFALAAPTVPPAPQPTLVTVVANLVNAVLTPLMTWGSQIPFVGPVLLAALAAVRHEFERALFPATTNVVAQQTTSQLVDPTVQRVLLIGVDGANLSRILALEADENENFRALMQGATNSAPSIVGHTTISNPSWSAILTGEWGEKTGVINNVFTPWTYDKFPTVFNQLEALPGEIDTMTIANWDVINAISAAGSDPVDKNLFVAQVEGDTNWLDTDDRVADFTVNAISAADSPDFLFSYFVGVDENGHLYGGASEEYKQALINMDENLGEIMEAIEDSGEEWTIIMVTDHGHQPQKGFGHGFQSPDETETFVIASGPAFKDGYINLQYEIVDTTPTVVSLFGGTPKPGSDGVTLMSLSGSDVGPLNQTQLVDALREQIASNKSPDIFTEIRLGARTIFATIPYLVYTELGSIPILGDLLYVVTNIPAQIVAFLTGVQGASIFPLLPPPPPSFAPENSALQVDCGPDAATCVAV
jgi:hypothetical protein